MTGVQTCALPISLMHELLLWVVVTMSEYTPTTDQVLEPTDASVRESFMYAQLAVRGLDTNAIGTPLTVKLSAAFDGWLAAHDAEITATTNQTTETKL